MFNKLFDKQLYKLIFLYYKGKIKVLCVSIVSQQTPTTISFDVHTKPVNIMMHL